MSENIENDEIDLLSFFKDIYKDKFLILFIVFIFTSLGILNLKQSTFTYEVELQVIPIQSSKNQESSKISSLASLAGISLQRSNERNIFDIYLHSLFSKSIASQLQKDSDLLKIIFKNEWSDANIQWITQKLSTSRKIKNWVKKLIGLPVYEPVKPGSVRLQSFIENNIRIKKVNNVTILYLDTLDQIIAKKLLYALHQTTDNYLKKRAYDRANEYIGFINKKLSTTFQKDKRDSLIATLSEQQKELMMATSSLPYAAEPLFKNSESSIFPTKPIASIRLAGYIISGLIFGLVIVISKSMYKRIFKD